MVNDSDLAQVMQEDWILRRGGTMIPAAPSGRPGRSVSLDMQAGYARTATEFRHGSGTRSMRRGLKRDETR